MVTAINTVNNIIENVLNNNINIVIILKVGYGLHFNNSVVAGVYYILIHFISNQKSISIFFIIKNKINYKIKIFGLNVNCIFNKMFIHIFLNIKVC